MQATTTSTTGAPVILAFELFRARIHIELNPTHPVSSKLLNHIAAYDALSKAMRECDFTPGESVAMTNLFIMLDHKMDDLLDESDIDGDVSRRMREIANRTTMLLHSYGRTVLNVCTSQRGVFHVKSISQQELFAVNKVLEAQHKMILIRQDWFDKK